MRVSTKIIDSSGSVTDGGVDIDLMPDTCPICHKGVTPHQVFGWCDRYKGYTGESSNKTLQVAYRCPRLQCRNLFIAYYRPTTSNLDRFSYERSSPITTIDHEFGDKITSISPLFEGIYNQASEAESQELTYICGPGYRKALEFLIKDYLIYLSPDDEEDIKGEFLGKSIKDRVSSPTIKAVAERAVWLGNDETHYTRRWDDKDLSDLKKLIMATVHWIEQEELAKDILSEMPGEDKGIAENNEEGSKGV